MNLTSLITLPARIGYQVARRSIDLAAGVGRMIGLGAGGADNRRAVQAKAPAKPRSRPAPAKRAAGPARSSAAGAQRKAAPAKRRPAKPRRASAAASQGAGARDAPPPRERAPADTCRRLRPSRPPFSRSSGRPVAAHRRSRPVRADAGGAAAPPAVDPARRHLSGHSAAARSGARPQPPVELRPPSARAARPFGSQRARPRLGYAAHPGPRGSPAHAAVRGQGELRGRGAPAHGSGRSRRGPPARAARNEPRDHRRRTGRGRGLGLPYGSAKTLSLTQRLTPRTGRLHTLRKLLRKVKRWRPSGSSRWTTPSSSPPWTSPSPSTSATTSACCSFPRHDGDFAKVGTVAEVADRVRLPGGGRAAALRGLHRGIAGAAQTDPSADLRVEVEERPDDVPVDGRTRELEREYRAVVEEILELRGDDGRVAAFVRSITEPGALADTVRLLPRPHLRAEGRAARDARRDRAPRARARASSASAWPSCRCASASATTSQSGAEKQQREYFLRKQMDSIRKELGEDDGLRRRGVPRRRSRRPACPTPCASRPSASSAASSAWASSRARPR